MFNFKNLFRNHELDVLIEKIKSGEQPNMNYVDPVKVPGHKEPKQALFTVGMNTDGQTQLTVGYPTSITLTLDDASVAYLIKQLGVNIDHAYEVKVKELLND